MKFFIVALVTSMVLNISAYNTNSDTAILIALSLIIAHLIVKD